MTRARRAAFACARSPHPFEWFSAATQTTGFEPSRIGYHRGMDNTEPVLRFDDEVDAAAQLVPQFGYDEAERIIDEAVRTHRPVESFVDAA